MMIQSVYEIKLRNDCFLLTEFTFAINKTDRNHKTAFRLFCVQIHVDITSFLKHNKYNEKLNTKYKDITPVGNDDDLDITPFMCILSSDNYTIVETNIKLMVNNNNIDTWIKYAQRRSNETIIGFLNNLKSKILTTNDLNTTKRFKDGKCSICNNNNNKNKLRNKNQSVENERASYCQTSTFDEICDRRWK